MKISVLITTRNRAEILRECLKSLVSQSRKPDEIVVVDNSSSDNTKEIIKSFHGLKIKYFLEKNIGIAFGRNKGLMEAKGDIFAFIDDDCVASKNWLKEIEITFKNDKNIVGVVGRNENMFPKNPYATAEQCWFLYWYLRHIVSIDMKQKLNDGDLINFKNAAFRSSFFRSMLFNTQLMSGKYSEEDTEIRGLIFNKLNLKQHIIYLPDATVYHRNRVSLDELLARRFHKEIASNDLFQKEKRYILTNAKRLKFRKEWFEMIIKEIKQLKTGLDRFRCLFVIYLIALTKIMGSVAGKLCSLFNIQSRRFLPR